MKLRISVSLATALTVLCAVSFLVPTDAHSQSAIVRLAAQHKHFDNTEESPLGATPIAGGTGGIVIYNKTLFVPRSVNVLYVTMSAELILNGPNTILLFSCAVDGSPCNPGSSTLDDHAILGDLPGWVLSYGGTSLFGDISYTWCAPVTPGTHTVAVRIASVGGGSPTALGATHFFVDGSLLPGAVRCTATP